MKKPEWLTKEWGVTCATVFVLCYAGLIVFDLILLAFSDHSMGWLRNIAPSLIVAPMVTMAMMQK